MRRRKRFSVYNMMLTDEADKDITAEGLLKILRKIFETLKRICWRGC